MKSATTVIKLSDKRGKFQSTHPWRVRLQLHFGIDCRTKYFNPRTHEECDGFFDPVRSNVPDFNPRTHEECDFFKSSNTHFFTDFNPRTHEECDAFLRLLSSWPPTFQSTHPWRVRRDRMRHLPDVPVISIHAPMKSATGAKRYLVQDGDISIHAPMKSATEIFWIIIESKLFQSTHPWRVRRNIGKW